MDFVHPQYRSDTPVSSLAMAWKASSTLWQFLALVSKYLPKSRRFIGSIPKVRGKKKRRARFKKKVSGLKKRVLQGGKKGC